MAPSKLTRSLSCWVEVDVDFFILEPASTAGKAPASTATGTASKAPAKTVDKAAKKATKKTAVPVDGEKKKTRKKARKETYSSYIYKGIFKSVFLKERG